MATRAGSLLGVTLFFLGLYGLTFHGYVDVEDTEVCYQATQSLVESGSLALGDTASAAKIADDGFYVVESAGGTYPLYPLAQIALPVPFYLAGRALQDLAHEQPEEVVRMAYSGFNVLVGALICAVVLLLGRQLGLRERTAVVTALFAGSCTMLWAYAQGTFADAPLTLFVVLAAWCLFRAGPERGGGGGWLVVAGLCHGLAILVRPAGLLLLLPSLLYLRRGGLGRAAAFLLPAAALVAGVLYVDIAVLGRPLEASYAAQADPALAHSYTLGLHGLLLSDGKGLFILSPFLLLSLLGFPALSRQRPREAGLIAGHLAVLALFFAAFDGWYGGWCWGPRYLLPAVPLLAVAAGFWLEGGRRWRLLLTVPLVLVSLWIQVLSVAVPHRIYMKMVSSHGGGDVTQFFYYTRFSPVLAHQRILSHKLDGGEDVYTQHGLFGEPDERPVDVALLPNPEISRFNRGFDHLAWMRVWQKGHTAGALIGAGGGLALIALGLALALLGSRSLSTREAETTWSPASADDAPE